MSFVNFACKCSCLLLFTPQSYAKEMLPNVDLPESIGQVLNVKVRTSVASKNSKGYLSVCPDLLAQCGLQ